MNLSVELEGLRLTLDGEPHEVVWAAARAAFDTAVRESARLRGQSLSSPLYRDDESNRPRPNDARGTKLEQIRDIARVVLSDGHVHERREIAKAVREAGLDPNPLNKALDGHFERGTNMDGRPTYRDTSVPAPWRTEAVSDDEKPPWLRNHPPAHEDGDLERIQAAANGAP